MGRTGIYACEEYVSRRNSLESVALFSLKQEALASIGGSTFTIQLVGSLAALYLTIFIFLVSCVGLGLSISAVAKNMQQVMVYCFLFLMPMILLSGLATPVRNMPQVLQYVTYINPMRFAIEAIRRIYLEGAGISAIAYTYLPMLAVAAVTLPLAAWLFRHKLS